MGHLSGSRCATPALLGLGFDWWKCIGIYFKTSLAKNQDRSSVGWPMISEA